MEVEIADIRKAKLALIDAVREADVAVKASLPSPDEIERIKAAFDVSLGKVAKMVKQPTPQCDLTKPTKN